MKLNNVFLLVFILIGFYNISLCDNPIKPAYVNKPPVIDGALDDMAWEKATRISEFKTYAPDYGFDISEQTIAFLAYDKENLYFAFHCMDKEPSKIKTSITSRDKIDTDDWVCLNIDSFNDHQSLYAFYVNAMGVQMDTRFSAGNEDVSMDYVWYSAAKLDSSGYYIEVCIPLKSIRYSDKNPVEMAITIERNISRKSERATFPAIDPKKGMSAFLTQMQPILYYDLMKNTLLEILPAITYSQKYISDKGELITDEKKGNFSITAKYGITSDLIIDGTYNPDFSQIESDAGQVDINLRSEIFYPEKRPFFFEGNENFKLSASPVNELDPIRTILHTRKIIKPVAGLKLSGKIDEKNTIAAIYALDDVSGRFNGNIKYSHFPILRYKRSLDNDSYIGAIFAGMERKDLSNEVFGIDAAYRVSPSSIFECNGLISTTKEDDLSNKNGHTIGLYYHNEERDQDYNISLKEVSKDFITETGYITRDGILSIGGLFRKRFYPGTDLFRQIYIEFFSNQTNDKYSNMWETFNHISLQGSMWKTTTLRIKYWYADEIFLNKKFLTGGIGLYFGSQVTRQLYLNSTIRTGKAIYYSAEPYQGKNNSVTSSMIFQVTDQLETVFDFTYSDFYKESNSEKIYDYSILRGKLQYQININLFLRGIVEYNSYRKSLLSDFLASFTYIPGTVIYLGYGSLYEKTEWINQRYQDSNNFLETKRGFFFKASYLWRI